MNKDTDDLDRVYKKVYKPIGVHTPQKRAYNPLYDGRTGSTAPFKFNRLYLIPIMCLLALTYWFNDLKDKPIVEDELSQAAKEEKNHAIFDETAAIIQIGAVNDPRVYNRDGDTLPPILNPYRTDVVEKPALIAEASTERREKLRRKRPIASAVLNGIDTFSNKIVFAGSFVNRDNAERMLTRLKTIGYNKAEIVMKEKLPYNVVVTRIDNQQIRAKPEVRTLQKRGIEVYAAEKNMEEIFRTTPK
ncbi:MAG: hypothetical protein U5L45_18125 [Saprospiraceae bacterium]|nr:hypothetical protein [Saprospiraceae bacterium]